MSEEHTSPVLYLSDIVYGVFYNMYKSYRHNRQFDLVDIFEKTVQKSLGRLVIQKSRYIEGLDLLYNSPFLMDNDFLRYIQEDIGTGFIGSIYEGKNEVIVMTLISLISRKFCEWFSGLDNSQRKLIDYAI